MAPTAHTKSRPLTPLWRFRGHAINGDIRINVSALGNTSTGEPATATGEISTPNFVPGTLTILKAQEPDPGEIDYNIDISRDEAHDYEITYYFLPNSDGTFGEVEGYISIQGGRIVRQ